MSSDDSTRDSLFLLAPGLLHYLGNALFAGLGRVQLLGAGSDLAADRSAIHDALDRASGGLHVLRWVLGDESQGPQALWTVLQRLQETLRVSLREHGLRIELQGEAEAGTGTVPAAATTRALLAVVRELVQHASAGIRGAVIVKVVGCNAVQAELLISLVPLRGGLPFPLDLPRCAELVQPALARENADASVAPGDMAIRLLVRKPTGAAATFP